MNIDIFSHDKYIGLRYPLGFCIGCQPPLNCLYVKIPFFIPFYIHKNTKYGMSCNDEKCIVIIGTAIHPSHPEMDLSHLSEFILFSKNPQTEIDMLIGRFAVIIKTQWQFTIQTDAIGLRSLFYATYQGRIIVSTHAFLLSEIIGGGKSDIIYKLGYPGLSTCFAAIKRVPVNCTLSLENGEIYRFFPVDEASPITIEEAWWTAMIHAESCFEALSKRYNILVSLTAGHDSRTTLAASQKFWHKCKFFTYITTPVNYIDAKVAQDIVRIYNLDHIIFSANDSYTDNEINKYIERNTLGRHHYNLSNTYYKIFPQYYYIHVRTNLTELFRSHLPKILDKYDNDKATIMTDFYYNSWGKAYVSKTEEVKEEFENFCTVTQYDKIPMTYKLNDLYYIEHRMPCWQAGVVCESDIVFETIIAFNSRAMIRLFLSVPQKERQSKYLRTMLDRYLPQIKSIPINPKEYKSLYRPII